VDLWNRGHQICSPRDSLLRSRWSEVLSVQSSPVAETHAMWTDRLLQSQPNGVMDINRVRCRRVTGTDALLFSNNDCLQCTRNM
jgi:hypothetical protein